MRRDSLGRFAGNSGGISVEARLDKSGLFRKFDAFTPALRQSIKGHLRTFAEGLRSHTISHYLSGSPLHQRSGNLIKALNVSDVTETEHSLSISVGDNIEYAAQHEFGLTVDVPAHSRLMTMAFGRAVAPREIEVRAHTASYPVRAFLAPALRDKATDFETEMDAAVAEAAEATNGTA